ncbi:MAG: phosphopantothenoylcysteine decarboxylase, partial [Acetivibrio sp.]
GYAIARECMLRGGEVTLVTGPTREKYPEFVKIIPIISAENMFRVVKDNFMEQDIIIKAAAVADYRPVSAAPEKIKKEDG